MEGGTQTMSRTRVVFNDVGFLLEQGQDDEDLKRRIEGAAHAGGEFVEFVVVGNRAVSVLVSPATHVMISVEPVESDARDLGDDTAPFGGEFDMI